MGSNGSAPAHASARRRWTSQIAPAACHNHRQGLRQAARQPGREAQASGGITNDHEGDLAQLDADIEADQGPHQRVARQIELGQCRGKTQPVDQAEDWPPRSASAARCPTAPKRFSTRRPRRDFEAAISGLDDARRHVDDDCPSTAKAEGDAVRHGEAGDVDIGHGLPKAARQSQQGDQEQQVIDSNTGDVQSTPMAMKANPAGGRRCCEVKRGGRRQLLQEDEFRTEGRPATRTLSQHRLEMLAPITSGQSPRRGSRARRSLSGTTGPGVEHDLDRRRCPRRGSRYAPAGRARRGDGGEKRGVVAQESPLTRSAAARSPSAAVTSRRPAWSSTSVATTVRR